MRKAYTYRLSPTSAQEKVLFWTLTRCRELYNAALSERRDAYRMAGQSISYYEQKRDLPAIKAEIREEYQQIHSQVLQDVLLRLKKAFDAFFRRSENGEEPGYPRFQGRNRSTSFTYPQGGYSLTHDRRVCLSKIGSIKVKMHREMQGTIKTATIKYEAGQWHIVFSCEGEQPAPLPKEIHHCQDASAEHSSTEIGSDERREVDSAIGIDLGLLHFATLSDGSRIENPRFFRKTEKKLEKLQQSLARKKRGSHRRGKAVKRVAKCHRKVRKQRKDFLHKQSRQLVNAYSLMVFEELHPVNMSKRAKPKQDEKTGAYLPNGAAAKSGLNKSIQDAGWSMFVSMCIYKAECAGREVLHVNPRYSSQVCSGCGTVRKKTLDERWHSCACGTELDRDHNAAIVRRFGAEKILSKGEKG